MIFGLIFFEIICKTINRFTNWEVTRVNVDEIIFFKKNYISSMYSFLEYLIGRKKKYFFSKCRSLFINCNLGGKIFFINIAKNY